MLQHHWKLVPWLWLEIRNYQADNEKFIKLPLVGSFFWTMLQGQLVKLAHYIYIFVTDNGGALYI